MSVNNPTNISERADEYSVTKDIHITAYEGAQSVPQIDRNTIKDWA